MIQGTKQFGVECPECGSLYTGVQKAGIDANGTRLRRRSCKNCMFNFNTIEIPVEYDYYNTDTTREPERVRVARRSTDYFNLTYAHDRTGEKVISVSAHIRKGEDSDFCYSGRHRLVGKNVYLRPDGGRNCRECTRERERIYLEVNRQRINQRRKEWRQRRKNDRISGGTSSERNYAGTTAIETR